MFILQSFRQSSIVNRQSSIVNRQSSIVNRNPVRMRFLVQDQILVQQLTVRARNNAPLAEEGLERFVKPRKVVEGDPGEIMVLQVVIGPEVGEVPEPAGLYLRAPLRRVAGLDVIMLSQAIQGKRRGKNQEERHKIHLPKYRPSGEQADEQDQRKLIGDCHFSLESDPFAHRFWIRSTFLCRRAEINRKERRGEIERLVPAPIQLGR